MVHLYAGGHNLDEASQRALAPLGFAHVYMLDVLPPYCYGLCANRTIIYYFYNIIMDHGLQYKYGNFTSFLIPSLSSSG